MREITEAEYRAALAILSFPTESERERTRRSGLASSTYNVARRRMFSEGWLSDVLIPSPGPCGFSSVEFRLERPGLAERSVRLEEWTRDPSCAVLWSGIHAIFGVFFRVPTRRPVSDPEDSPGESDRLQLSVDRRSGEVPVYFDYSGAWARFGEEVPSGGYPTGLDLTTPPRDARTLRRASSSLTSDRRDPPVGGRWTNLLRLPRAQRRAIEQDLLRPRTVLDHAKAPPLDGRRIGEVLFVFGRWRAGGTAPGLLARLTGECGAYPLLLAGSEEKVLLLALGQTSARAPGRVPIRSARSSVMDVITGLVDGAQVVIEPVEALTEVIHHRYPAPPAGDRPTLRSVD